MCGGAYPFAGATPSEVFAAVPSSDSAAPSSAFACARSSGRTSPCTTPSAPSSPMVTMHPAMARSSRRKTARRSMATWMASMRASAASASAAIASVHSSSSRLVELADALGERLELRGLRVGLLAGLGVHPPVARGGRPVDLEVDLGPRPAGAKLLRRGLEPLHGEPSQNLGVVEPHPGFVVVGE